MQVLNLRLVYEERFMNKKDIDILEDVRKAGVKNAKINSIKPNYEFDRRDQRYLKGIKNINLVYELEGNKTLTLTGNMQCVYDNNFKGEFFCKRARIDNSGKCSDFWRNS